MRRNKFVRERLFCLRKLNEESRQRLYEKKQGIFSRSASSVQRMKTNQDCKRRCSKETTAERRERGREGEREKGRKGEREGG